MSRKTDEIVVGDVVHLKTRQDPKMVVNADYTVHTPTDMSKVMCAWIDYAMHYHEVAVDRRCLVKVK